MLVDIGFPEPVLEDRSEHIKRIIEELRAELPNIDKYGFIRLSCPLEHNSPYSLDDYEVTWIKQYFYKYGWNFTHDPDGRSKTTSVSLYSHKDFREKKLKESLCSLT